VNWSGQGFPAPLAFPLLPFEGGLPLLSRSGRRRCVSVTWRLLINFGMDCSPEGPQLKDDIMILDTVCDVKTLRCLWG